MLVPITPAAIPKGITTALLLLTSPEVPGVPDWLAALALQIPPVKPVPLGQAGNINGIDSMVFSVWASSGRQHASLADIILSWLMLFCVQKHTWKSTDKAINWIVWSFKAPIINWNNVSSHQGLSSIRGWGRYLILKCDTTIAESCKINLVWFIRFMLVAGYIRRAYCLICKILRRYGLGLCSWFSAVK